MFNFQNYFKTAFPTEDTKCASDNVVVYEDSAIRLRFYKSGERKIPTLILPPQAGHDHTIADYAPGRSLVETVLETRRGPVYLVEWLSCTQERKGETVSDLIKQVEGAAAHVASDIDQVIRDGRFHLIGLCQGGWLATMFTSEFPEYVETLTCIASPIDFHSGGGAIYDMITKYGMLPYEMIVNMYNGIMPGKMMLLGWEMMHPTDRFINDYCDIAMNAYLGETEKLKEVERFRRWYKKTQDIAGTWYLDVCENLFLKNKLVKGEFAVDGEIIDLYEIDCPVIMIAGEKDDITLPRQVYALAEHVSTYGDDKYMDMVKGKGHIGSFMSKEAQVVLAKSIRWLGY